MINNFFITIKLQVHVYRTYIYGYCIFYDEHLLQKNCTGGKQFHVQNIFEYSFQV